MQKCGQMARLFFDSMNKSGADPATTKPGDTVTPQCAKTLTRAGKTYVMVDYTTIKAYHTGDNEYAKNCPAPWQDMTLDSAVVV